MIFIEEVVHIYNPSYSGGTVQEDLSSRTDQAKIHQDPHLNTEAGCGGAHLSYQLYRGHRRIMVQGWPRAKMQDPI
jgi:hypothetical protein